MIFVSESGALWLARLTDSDPPGPSANRRASVPVAVQALLSSLAGSDDRAARLTATDAGGRPVEVTAERAVRLDAERGEEVTGGYSVLIARSPLAADASALTGAQWAVAQAVARGLSDREIADSLQASMATVHEHVAALHQLLGTATRPRLVAELAGALPPPGGTH